MFPEMAGGFTGSFTDIPGFSQLALQYSPGDYRVKVGLEAIRNTEDTPMWFFLGRRHLSACYSEGAEVSEVSGTVHIGEFIPRGTTQVYNERLNVALISHTYVIASVEIRKIDLPVIHIAGDSTSTDQPAELPYDPMANYAGWGQMLPLYLTKETTVANHAHSGLTTESFRTEGHYDILRKELKAGDYVLLQFAHNDQKLAHLAAERGYRDNLLRYVDEIRGAGAFPVLITPLSRNTWNQEGGYNDLLAAHSEAVIRAGNEMSVPVLDLHGKSMDAIRMMGQDHAGILYHPGDLTHTNDLGAYLAAGVIASELRRTLTGNSGDYRLLKELVSVDQEDCISAGAVFAQYRQHSEQLLQSEYERKAYRSGTDKTGVVPEDLTGPAVWQTGRDGILRNPDGSLVPEP